MIAAFRTLARTAALELGARCVAIAAAGAAFYVAHEIAHVIGH